MAGIDSIARALATTDIKETDEALVTFSDGIQRKLNTKEDAEEVARIIENAPRMTALEFRGNTIGVEAGARIAQALEKHPELQRALWSDMFTGRLKTEIPPILRSLCKSMMAVNVHLTELDLSDNAFGPIGAEGIEDFLRSPSAFSLQALKLNNNGLGGGGKVIAKALLDCHSNSTAAGRPLKLKVFVAGRNRLENPGAIALAASFAKIGTLEEVTIPQNGIYYKGVTALARAFRKNKNLRVLNLSDNTFTIKGATAMSKVLPMLTNLEVINFSDCLCRDEGTKLIVTAIGDEHKALKDVNLSGNEIGPDVAKLVLQKFAGSKSLNVMLQANNFGSRFSEIQNAANEATFSVDVGVESDDEGSLSSGEEEEGGEGEKSASEASDSEDSGSVSDNEASGASLTESGGEDGAMKNGHTRAELDHAQSFNVFMQNPSLTALQALGSNPSIILVAHLQDEISDRNPDAVAKVVINLGSIVTAGNEGESLHLVVECADAILHEAESIAMAPLSPIAQIVNNLLARIGVVKTDSAVERPSNLYGLLRLLGALIDRGHFAAHLTTLGYFFGQRVKKEYPQHVADIDTFLKQVDSAISEWDREQ